MMDATLLGNLGAYTAQVICITALGTVVAAILHVDAAGIRYLYWRLLLGVCIVLPFLQVWRDPAELAGAVGGTTEAGMVSTELGMAVAVAPAGAGAGIDWLLVASVVLAAGVVARLVWIAASLMSLRRMRTLGTLAVPQVFQVELQRQLGTRAEIRHVDGLRQPVTFGALRPVVLLPASLADHPETIQRAVLCHELFHVQRRDWLWVLGEEAVRALLWFNPAVWWLIARVQLAREEVVDELTVLATNRRRAYIEALMTFADETPLAPAAAFARRRHLFRRMLLLSKEAVMSPRRLVLSSFVMAFVMLTGSWFTVGAFPLTLAAPQATQVLTEPGPLERAARPVTPENPVPRRVNHADAVYPADAEVLGMSGAIRFWITLDEIGRVAEVRRMTITFMARDRSLSGSFNWASQRDLDSFVKGFEGRHPNLTGLRQALLALEQAAFDAVRQWRYDPPHEGPISFNVSLPVGIAPPPGGRLVAPPPPPSSPSPLAGAEGALRVGGNIKAPSKIHHVNPVYPEVALQARVSGVVILETLIGPDGTVQDARVLRSIPLLDEAAREAVMQWRFTPTLLNGQAVPVIMTVTVNFTVQ